MLREDKKSSNVEYGDTDTLEDNKNSKDTKTNINIITEKKKVDKNSIKYFINNNKRGMELFNCIYRDTTKTLYYYSKVDNVFEFVSTDKELRELIEIDYPEFTKFETNDKGKTTKKDLLPNGFISKVKQINTIDMIVKDIDFFQKEVIKLEKVGRILYITKNYMEFKKFNLIDTLSVEEEQEIINDYKEHWEGNLEPLLKWFISCRFSHSRRESFLHLKLNAGFGKTFLMSILKDLGLFVEGDYSDFKNPSPMDSVEFENSIGLVIDEFTIFKQEFKKFTHFMTLTSKYRLRTEVKLYSKLFLSAEESGSFVDGVDKQITDRVCSIHLEKGNLGDRLVLKKYTNLVYYNVILKYIYFYMTKNIDTYIKMGLVESSSISDTYLKEFHKKHSIKSLDIKEVIYNKFNEKIYTLITNNDYLNKQDTDIKNNIEMDDNFIYVKSPKKTLEMILQQEDEDFYKKAKFKIREYEDIISYKMKVKKINGSSVMRWFIPKEDLFNIFDSGVEENSVKPTKEVPTTYETIKQDTLIDNQQSLKVSNTTKKEPQKPLKDLLTTDIDLVKQSTQEEYNKNQKWVEETKLKEQSKTVEDLGLELDENGKEIFPF